MIKQWDLVGNSREEYEFTVSTSGLVLVVGPAVITVGGEKYSWGSELSIELAEGSYSVMLLKDGESGELSLAADPTVVDAERNQPITFIATVKVPEGATSLDEAEIRVIRRRRPDTSQIEPHPFKDYFTSLIST